MKTFRTMLFVLTLALASTSAFAWPSCSGNWVSVPKTTTGGTLYSTGDLLFQCQIPTPPSTPTTPSTSNTNNNSNSNNNSSKSSSSSTSGASAGAVSGSSSVAKGGSATANGGSVKDSGNSSSSAQGGKGGNANQGQDQGQSQSSTSSANGNGNGANNSEYSSTSNTLVQRNTPMAYAPEAIPSAPCVKGYSAGASGPAFGASFGGGKTDQECEIRETARAFALGGSRIAYCKVLITTKDAKKAGVTLDDCLQQPTPAPVAQTVIVPPVPAPVIVETPNVPLEVVAPVETTLVTVHGGVLNNVAKQQLDQAVIYAKQSQGGHLIIQTDALTGVARGQRVLSYFSEAGINTSSVEVRLTKSFGRDVVVVYSLN